VAVPRAAVDGLRVAAEPGTPLEATNGATGCSVDPDGVVGEALESNNGCNPSTVTVRADLVFADGFDDGTFAAWTDSIPR